VRRHLFNVLAGISFLLCATTLVAWSRSYGILYLDHITFDPQPRAEREWGVWLRNGRFSISYGRIDWPNKMGPLPKPQGWQFHPDSQWNGQTQQYYREAFLDNWHLWSIDLPAPLSTAVVPFPRVWGWHIGFNLLISAALLAILPAIWHVRFLRTKSRRQERLCMACGYDLRATPNRCPECGLVSEKAAISM
jgi:hypothetical protein